MGNSTTLNSELDNFRVSFDKIKNLLVNRFLLFGLIVAFIAVIIPILPINTAPLSEGFYFDFINLGALLTIYLLKNKLSLSFKISFIIVIIYSFFITNLFQEGLGALSNSLIILVPFLSIQIFSVRQTIGIHTLAILSFLGVGIVHLSKPYSFSNPEFTNGLIEWGIYALLLSLVCLVVALLVYYLNDSMLRLINRIELNNQQLIKQDTILKQNIEEKKVLLQEIHHRVKNNLAVVSGLLDLQSNRAPDDFSRTTLKLSTNRILSISKVHELLYQSEDISRIHFKQYVKELADIIIDSFNKTGKEVQLSLDVHIQYLNINHGVPVGIILNELITNSLKHGFSKHQENYQITISALEEMDHYSITYADNGSGITLSESENSVGGLGKTLIESLLQQIEATCTLNTENKYQLSFRFPK
jgi:two-component sensor histidine kinase